MPYTVLEQIEQEIESRLENVTKANGFNQTLIVRRPTRKGVGAVVDFLAVVSRGDIQPDTTISPNGVGQANPPYQAWEQTYEVLLFSRQSDRDETAAEILMNQMAADALEAITRKGETDEAEWYTFGGLARNASIGAPSQGLWEDSVSAVLTLPIIVNFRHTENDPYTAR